MARPGRYKRIAWLDNLLTGLAASLTCGTFWSLRNDLWSLGVLLSSFFGALLVINKSKQMYGAIARVIGTEKALSKPRNARKFADQGWQLTIHTCFSLWELYIFSEDNFDMWTDAQAMNNGRRITTSLKLFYLAQLGIWMYMSFSHRFIELRHKDYHVMFTHHVLTHALVLGSYVSGYLRIGVFVLLIHDVSDVPLDLLKMFNYMGLDMDNGLPIVELAFVSTLVSWFYWRLYLFPMSVIYHIFTSKGTGTCPDLHMFEQHGPMHLLTNGDQACHAMRTMLCMLLGLHFYWFYLLVRIATRLLWQSENAHTVGRDEYEGTSSDSPMEYDSKKLA